MQSISAPSEEVCVINIGPGERHKRMRFGVVFYVISAALAAWMIATGQPLLHRLWLFLPLVIAGTGVFQARAKT